MTMTTTDAELELQRATEERTAGEHALAEATTEDARAAAWARIRSGAARQRIAQGQLEAAAFRTERTPTPHLSVVEDPLDAAYGAAALQLVEADGAGDKAAAAKARQLLADVDRQRADRAEGERIAAAARTAEAALAAQIAREAAESDRRILDGTRQEAAARRIVAALEVDQSMQQLVAALDRWEAARAEEAMAASTLGMTADRRAPANAAAWVSGRLAGAGLRGFARSPLALGRFDVLATTDPLEAA